MKNGELALAVLTGAAIGAAAGPIFAPDSGRNTRDGIKKEVERTCVRLENAALELKGNVAELLDHDGDELAYLIGSAIAKGTVTTDDVIKILGSQIKKTKSKIV